MSQQEQSNGSHTNNTTLSDTAEFENNAISTALDQPSPNTKSGTVSPRHSLDVGDGLCASKQVDSVSSSKLSSDLEEAESATVRQAYGNYHTVSGTDANVLRDVFNKKYRASAMRPADAKSKRGAIGQGVRFTSPHDNIREEDPSSVEPYRGRSDSKSLKDLFTRKRNKSGPDSSVQADAKPKGTTTRVRTFFDSFRSRPRSISVSEAPGSPLMSSLVPRPNVPVVTATVGKKKKFKVTPASVSQSAKQRGDQRRVSPEDFVEMFRSRTDSDPRNALFLREKALVNMRQKTLHQPTAAEMTTERRKSDPSLHDAFLLNPKVSNYATVAGSTAAKLSNYQKLSSHTPLNEDTESRPFEPVHVVIWKDKKKGTRVFALPSQEAEYLGSGSEDQLYIRFMQSRCCYEAMPYSTKLVVFDTQLNVKKAFFALLQNGVRAAALWDTKRQDVVGMLTITDFIQILQRYYRSPQDRIDEVETQKIATWRDMLCEDKCPLVSIGPSDSLLEAVQRLYDAKVHRLLVINPQNGNPLHVLTYKRILRFVHSCIRNLRQPSFMRKTLNELQLGTYDNIAVANLDTALIEVLNTFVDRRVSAVPIVDADGRVVDIYSKFDAIDLAHEKAYTNLDVTIREAIHCRRENFESAHTCKKSETLFTVIEKMVNEDVHRLVIVDDAFCVEGMLSLSDVLHFLIISPLIESSKAKLAQDQAPVCESESNDVVETVASTSAPVGSESASALDIGGDDTLVTAATESRKPELQEENIIVDLTSTTKQ